MSGEAQEIIGNLASLVSQFGSTVQINRNTPFGGSPNVFGNSPQTVTSLTVNVIVEDNEVSNDPTIAGGKPIEKLQLITNPGTFLMSDEVVYNGHSYRVNFINPQPFEGVNVVDFVHCYREVG